MEQELPTLKTSQLEALAAVSTDIVREVVGVFLRTGRERVDALSRALAEEDRDRVRRLAHSMKGSAAAVGASRLSAAAAALEREASGEGRERGPVADGAGASIAAEFERARVEIESYVESLR